MPNPKRQRRNFPAKKTAKRKNVYEVGRRNRSRPNARLDIIMDQAINDAIRFVPIASRDLIDDQIRDKLKSEVFNAVDHGYRNNIIGSYRAAYSIANYVAIGFVERFVSQSGLESFLPKPPINPPKK